MISEIFNMCGTLGEMRVQIRRRARQLSGRQSTHPVPGALVSSSAALIQAYAYREMLESKIWGGAHERKREREREISARTNSGLSSILNLTTVVRTIFKF